MGKRTMEAAKIVVKEYFEFMMKMRNDTFLQEHGGLKNGFRERATKTKVREIGNLSVSKVREAYSKLEYSNFTASPSEWIHSVQKVV